MRKLETKRRRKWIKFKNKRLTTCSNLSKESNNGVTSSKEVEISPVNIASSNKDQQGNFPSAEQLNLSLIITISGKRTERIQMLLLIFQMILPFPVQRTNYQKVDWAIKLYW